MEAKQRINVMIQEARGWLERAQESYKNDNPVRGELNLHLAQAEIQRACETSREMVGENMFAISKTQREQQPAWLRYYSVGAVAAMVGILLYMGVNLVLFSDGEESIGKSLIASSWIDVAPTFLSTSHIDEEQGSKTHINLNFVAASEKRYVTNQQRTTQKPRMNPRHHGRAQTVAANAHDETNYDSTYYDLNDSRYYSLPGSNDWREASVSNWGEERIGNSVPSFSDR